MPPPNPFIIRDEIWMMRARSVPVTEEIFDPDDGQSFGVQTHRRPIPYFSMDPVEIDRQKRMSEIIASQIENHPPLSPYLPPPLRNVNLMGQLHFYWKDKKDEQHPRR